MKKIITKYSAVAAIVLLFASCSEDILQVQSKTAATSDYLYSSAEGLTKAIVGLYGFDRYLIEGINNKDETTIGLPILLDASTDIVVYRGGTTASLYRLEDNTPSKNYFSYYWKNYYKIIGKANEIIAGAKKIGLDDPEVARIFGEASTLRARAYFLLYQRFERLYINTEPTTLENAFDRTFRAASKKEIFDLLKADLQNGMDYLDWEPQKGASGNLEYGHVTKAVAMHIRAQVAMWEEDWTTAIKMCEGIFTEGAAYHELLPTPEQAFKGANLNNKENLFVFQFSDQRGGYVEVSGGKAVGHRLSLNTYPNYGKISGMKETIENGGHGWGRIYPNTYLLSLYDPAVDLRYKNLFQLKYYYNTHTSDKPEEDKFGKEVSVAASAYIEQAHPACLKYWDNVTITDPAATSHFKDVVVYRLGETALMCCEAYFHKEGSSTKAVEWFNKTYTRAGNAAKGAITMDDILDEYARECNFEGVRWPLLKRLGILGERVRLHSGDTKKEDPKLNADYIHARKNFKDERDYCWPIPQTELDLMPGFGQNEGWF